jgi:hypothetical protein
MRTALPRSGAAMTESAVRRRGARVPPHNAPAHRRTHRSWQASLGPEVGHQAAFLARGGQLMSHWPVCGSPRRFKRQTGTLRDVPHRVSSLREIAHPAHRDLRRTFVLVAAAQNGTVARGRAVARVGQSGSPRSGCLPAARARAIPARASRRVRPVARSQAVGGGVLDRGRARQTGLEIGSTLSRQALERSAEGRRNWWGGVLGWRRALRSTL